jgi:hypothetical protein
LSNIAEKPISAANLKAVLQDKSLFDNEIDYNDLSESLKNILYIAGGPNPASFDGVDWADLKKRVFEIYEENGNSYNYTSDDLYKTVSLSGYGTYKFVVVDIDSESNIITMQSLPLITTHVMNSSNTTSGGWASTAMRTWLNDTLLAAFPDDLKSVIKETTVKYDASTTGITSTCSDKLWLPSYQEVFGAGSSSNIKDGIEGTQFAYYANGGSKIKYLNSSAGYWWLRSVYDSPYFWRVSSSGGALSGTTSNSYGVAPCFCI